MAQAGGSAVAAVAMVALTLAATFWGAQAARKSTTLNVGDDSGWSLPSVTNVNYTLWASAHTYQVGDKLFFKYRPGTHDVLSVTGTNFNICEFNQPLFDDNGAGDTTFTLDKAGNYWFVCSVGGGRHCQAGMKLKITVAEASGAGFASAPVSQAVPALVAALAFAAAYMLL